MRYIKNKDDGSNKKNKNQELDRPQRGAHTTMPLIYTCVRLFITARRQFWGWGSQDPPCRVGSWALKKGRNSFPVFRIGYLKSAVYFQFMTYIFKHEEWNSVNNTTMRTLRNVWIIRKLFPSRWQRLSSSLCWEHHLMKSASWWKICPLYQSLLASLQLLKQCSYSFALKNLSFVGGVILFSSRGILRAIRDSLNISQIFTTEHLIFDIVNRNK